jgi:hypothetical protein
MATVELLRDNPKMNRYANVLLSKQVIHRLTITTHQLDQLINVDVFHVHQNGRKNFVTNKFSIYTPDRLIQVMLLEEQSGFVIHTVNGEKFQGTYEDAFLILLERTEHERNKYRDELLEQERQAADLVIH